MEKMFLAALQSVSGIGNSRLRILVDFFGSARQAWQADRRNLFLCKGLDDATRNQLIVQRERIDVESLAEAWQRKGITVLSLADEAYPALLRTIYNPPVLLYCRGKIPAADHHIAIVGSRRASPYGKNVASMLASELAAAGVTVVSGAARGIDTAAHKGALGRGYTVAVLGCGVDVVYPPENAKLLAAIMENGAVVSEYPPGTPAHAAYFPARNRIINGLSQGVVVVEAAERSGALITTDYALEEGRDVFAVPGSIFAESSRGVHRLIQQGAKLVTDVVDILEEYNVRSGERLSGITRLEADEQMVYSVLGFEKAVGIETIVEMTGLSTSAVAYILLQMEIRGLITAQGGQQYLRLAKEGIS